MSIFLVAVMFAAVMQTVGAGRMAHYKTVGRHRGLLLSQQLLSEIRQHGYEDPDVATVSLGVDAFRFHGMVQFSTPRGRSSAIDPVFSTAELLARLR